MAKVDALLRELDNALRCYQQRGEPLYTLGRSQPNWITEVGSSGVMVETRKSKGNPQLIRRDWLRLSILGLLEQQTLVAEMLPGSARYRSAFILTALSLLPGATHGGSPPSVTLRDC